MTNFVALSLSRGVISARLPGALRRRPAAADPRLPSSCSGARVVAGGRAAGRCRSRSELAGANRARAGRVRAGRAPAASGSRDASGRAGRVPVARQEPSYLRVPAPPCAPAAGADRPCLSASAPAGPSASPSAHGMQCRLGGARARGGRDARLPLDPAAGTEPEAGVGPARIRPEHLSECGGPAGKMALPAGRGVAPGAGLRRFE